MVFEFLNQIRAWEYSSTPGDDVINHSGYFETFHVIGSGSGQFFELCEPNLTLPNLT